MHPEVYAVIAAAGSGTRLGSGRPKALVSLGGRSILERCLDGLATSGVIDHAVVTVSTDMVEAVNEIVASGRGMWGSMRVDVVRGGAERVESVAAGLQTIEFLCREHGGPDADLTKILVAVHDAARCLTPSTIITAVVEAARTGMRELTWSGAVPVLPVVDTVKVVETISGGALDGAEVLRSTPVRDNLRAAQTPQVFQLAALLEANQMDEARRELDSVHPTGLSQGPVATDDASLMELAGQTIIAVPGDPLAFKITLPEDLERAQRVVEGFA